MAGSRSVQHANGRAKRRPCLPHAQWAKAAPLLTLKFFLFFEKKTAQRSANNKTTKFAPLVLYSAGQRRGMYQAQVQVLAMGGLRAGVRNFGSIIMSCGEILFWAVFSLVYAVASGGISC